MAGAKSFTRFPSEYHLLAVKIMATRRFPSNPRTTKHENGQRQGRGDASRLFAGNAGMRPLPRVHESHASASIERRRALSKARMMSPRRDRSALAFPLWSVLTTGATAARELGIGPVRAMTKLQRCLRNDSSPLARAYGSITSLEIF